MAITRYSLSKDYNEGSQEHSSSPYWCIAIYRLGKPVSYSRRDRGSVSSAIDSVLLRDPDPLIIVSDCIQLSVSGNKNSYLKHLNATLKSGANYLSANKAVTGDWMFAWMFTNKTDKDRIVKLIRKGQPANDFMSGLKFIGRVEHVGKHLSVSPNGIKTVTYNLNGVGFDELSTSFFYDPAIASEAYGKDVFQFLAEIGVNAFKYMSALHGSASSFHDNTEDLMDSFINIVVGVGGKAGIAKTQMEDIAGNPFSNAPQLNSSAPYAYLIPSSVASILGKQITDERKGTTSGHNSYGYCNILTFISGVQKYTNSDPVSLTSNEKDPFNLEGRASDSLTSTSSYPGFTNQGGVSHTANHKGFLPDIEITSNWNDNRLKTPIRIKGTFIPVEPVFTNASLWSILGLFKNPTLNEMYTCIKPNYNGSLMPTIIYRQIPFSTQVMVEDPNLPLTRFMSLPRWVIPPSLVTDLNIGRGYATKFNMVHVYGQVGPFANPSNRTDIQIGSQMLKHAPIFDTSSIACYGLKPYMATVASSLTDVLTAQGLGKYIETIADWILGSEHTLNGTIQMKGVQSPIAEGDNCEIDGIVFHIESITHNCGITNGKKYFDTTLTVTNGMPADQGVANDIAPRYPGFKGAIDQADATERYEGVSLEGRTINKLDPFSASNSKLTDDQNEGDDDFNTSLNPGTTVED